MRKLSYYLRKSSFDLLLVTSGILIGVNNYDFITRGKDRLEEVILGPEVSSYQRNIQLLEELLDD